MLHLPRATTLFKMGHPDWTASDWDLPPNKPIHETGRASRVMVVT